MDDAELIRHLCDRCLLIADRVEKNTTSNDKLRDAILVLHQRVTEIYEQRDYTRHAVGHVDERLAVISKDVDDLDRAVREVTGKHALVEPREVPPATQLLQALRELPWSMKVPLISLAIIWGMHTEIATVIRMLLGLN